MTIRIKIKHYTKLVAAIAVELCWFNAWEAVSGGKLFTGAHIVEDFLPACTVMLQNLTCSFLKNNDVCCIHRNTAWSW